ncbi:hypothetical protein [Streptomyces sirii]|uniref:hypothetical protein n=1 Tax=Streptomyces sirii TaxID=3127701 RepID=UPI003D3654EC
MKEMRRWKFPRVAASVMLVFGCLGGCSAFRGDDHDRANVKQAVKRIDSVLDDTFKAIRPRIKWREGPAHISAHRNSFTNTANGEVGVGRKRYVRTKVSKLKLTELIKAVYKHWWAAGYEIGEMNTRRPTFSATAADGCVINFSVGGYGNISVSASVDVSSDAVSGDIWGEEGDKFPKAPNGGPDYAPDVRDPYWSK